MKNIKKALALVLALVMILGLGVSAPAAESDDGKIVILHTNDVHCGIDRAESDGGHYRSGLFRPGGGKGRNGGRLWQG